jgi:hypothetical protein
MKTRLICLLAFAFTAFNVHGQTPSAPRVPLAETAFAADANGRDVLGARLRTTELNGTIDSPVTNVLIVLENRAPFLYTYVSGWAMFYNTEGVRCGEALFKVDMLAQGESAETDAPGLRLRCAPTSWSIVPTNLLAPTSDSAKSNQSEPSMDGANASNYGMAMPQLEITIDGEILPLQLGNPIVLNTRKKKSVHIVVNARP